MKVVFVACVSEKMDRLAPAGDLYQSVWFRKAKAYAVATGDQWYILSAKHGVLSPGTYIEPYDVTLAQMSKIERDLWALGCRQWIADNIDLHHFELVFLAGRLYREPLVTMLDNEGYTVSVPMKGLGIGQQLQWLDKQLREKQLCSI